MTNKNNSSEFNFKWSKDNNKGKVFKTRQKPQQNIQSEVTKSVENSLETTTGKHIKRKQRKDKLLRKSQASNEAPRNAIANNPKEYSLFGEKQKDVYVNIQSGQSIKEDLFTKSGQSFKALDIHKHLVSNLEKIEYTKLTNVQEKSIPVILSGKNALVSTKLCFTINKNGFV